MSLYFRPRSPPPLRKDDDELEAAAVTADDVAEANSCVDGDVEAETDVMAYLPNTMVGGGTTAADDADEEADDVGDVDAVGLDEPHMEQTVVFSACLLRHTMQVHLLINCGACCCC